MQTGPAFEKLKGFSSNVMYITEPCKRLIVIRYKKKTVGLFSCYNESQKKHAQCRLQGS